MPVRVTCPHCGTEHESRVRARGLTHFSSINQAVGEVLECCPECGVSSTGDPAGRSWHDPPPRPRRPRSPT